MTGPKRASAYRDPERPPLEADRLARAVHVSTNAERQAVFREHLAAGLEAADKDQAQFNAADMHTLVAASPRDLPAIFQELRLEADKLERIWKSGALWSPKDDDAAQHRLSSLLARIRNALADRARLRR